MLEALPHYHRIQSGYHQMWEKGGLEISHGKVDADPIPGTTSLRWGVSIIARIVLPGLKAMIESARELCGGHHTFYHQGNLHITIRSCEFFRPDISANDPVIEAYQGVLTDVASQYGPFEVALCGLNANRVGIIAQGYPTTIALQDFRESLHRKLLAAGLHHGPEADDIRSGAHTSLSVFAGPIKDAQRLYGWISQNRTTWLDTVKITQLQLVHYRRTTLDVQPICLHQVDLKPKPL